MLFSYGLKLFIFIRNIKRKENLLNTLKGFTFTFTIDKFKSMIIMISFKKFM